MSHQNQPYRNHQEQIENEDRNDGTRSMSFLRRFRLPLALLGMLFILIVVASYLLWPDWLSRHGGWLLLPVAGAVAFLSALVSYLNDWEQIRMRRRQAQDVQPEFPSNASIVQKVERSKSVKQTIRSSGNPAGDIRQEANKSQDVKQNIDLR